MVVQENSEESGEESPPAESTISQRPKRNPRKRVLVLNDDDDASDASDPVSDRSYQPDQEEVVGKKNACTIVEAKALQTCLRTM